MVDTGRFYRAAKETLGNGNGHEVRVMGDGKILVLRCLMEGEFKTAGELSLLWGVSEKTVRVRLKEMKPEIESHGGRLLSKKGQGFRIQAEEEGFEQWLAGLKAGEGKGLPDTPAGRVEYLLAMLLNREDYIKFDHICEFLYISRSTLSGEMRQVEERLGKFHIDLERKPAYGVRIRGNEFDIRRCLMENRKRVEDPYGEQERKRRIKDQDMARFLLEQMREEQIRFSEMSFESILEYIHVAAGRVERGFVIREMPECCGEPGQEERRLAARIMEKIEKERGVWAGEAEIWFLGIFLAGKRIHGSGKGNLVISERIDRMVADMLEAVYEAFHMEFRDNLNLRMMLNQHLVSLDIRMRYGIEIDNPLLTGIQQKYLLAYSVAVQGSGVLKSYYGREIPEEEVGFLAFLFALALEERENRIEKKNVLLVCASGRASSRMLLYQLKKEFADYLDQVSVCNVYELEDFDLPGVDYIFATVPIYRKVTVPVIEIHDFLEYGDLLAARKILENGDRQFLLEFYRREFFFSHVKGSTREEVIREMCEGIRRHYPLPEEFEASVLEREELGATDYGNLVAIPHPARVLVERNIVAAAILEEPVKWSRNRVQLVVLVALTDSMEEKVQKFYEITSRVLLSPDKVGEIIKSRRYETLLKVFFETD